MTRDEFMNEIYYECNDDTDNYRANRIIDAADEYACDLWEDREEELRNEIAEQVILKMKELGVCPNEQEIITATILNIKHFKFVSHCNVNCWEESCRSITRR